jgi:hypothetical protein
MNKRVSKKKWHCLAINRPNSGMGRRALVAFTPSLVYPLHKHTTRAAARAGRTSQRRRMQVIQRAAERRRHTRRLPPPLGICAQIIASEIRSSPVPPWTRPDHRRQHVAFEGI